MTNRQKGQRERRRREAIEALKPKIAVHAKPPDAVRSPRVRVAVDQAVQAVRFLAWARTAPKALRRAIMAELAR